MKYKTELTQLGSFSIAGKMRVSDPCYKPDVWCSGVLDTKPGIWEAAVLILDSEVARGWCNRVAVLAAKHKDCPLPLTTHTINNTVDETSPQLSKDWKIADFEVGVDSGQAGFYDNTNFVTRNVDEDANWYDKMCSITLSKEADVFEDGVVAGSGYGDGGYSCIYHTNADGKVDFAYVIFIGDDEDEEEDH